MTSADPEPTLQPHEVLESARVIRKHDPDAATEALSRALETLAAQLGTNEHPDLGLLWLEYGDLLLQIEETGIMLHLSAQRTSTDNPVENSSISSTDASASVTVAQNQQAVDAEKPKLSGDDSMDSPDEAQDCSEDTHEEDDLLLAYECLEIARRCFESKPTKVPIQDYARMHYRLGDFQMLQSRPEEAVTEYRASIALERRAPDMTSSSTSSHTKRSNERIEKVLGKILRAQMLSMKPIETLIQDDDELVQLLRAYKEPPASNSQSSITSTTGFCDEIVEGRGPAMEVRVQSKKRRREESEALDANAM